MIAFHGCFFFGHISVTIVHFSPIFITLLVSFKAGKEAKEVHYQKEQPLKLAYAITIHKSQGNEFEAIVIPVVTQHLVCYFVT